VKTWNITLKTVLGNKASCELLGVSVTRGRSAPDTAPLLLCAASGTPVAAEVCGCEGGGGFARKDCEEDCEAELPLLQLIVTPAVFPPPKNL